MQKSTHSQYIRITFQKNKQCELCAVRVVQNQKKKIFPIYSFSIVNNMEKY